jgi:hypothetical protein
VRGKIPCASRRCGVAQTVHPCTAAQARRSIAAPLRAFSATPAMLGTANGAFVHESVHPCTASRLSFRSAHDPCELLLLLLRQDAAQLGPPVARRARGGRSPQGWRAGCAPVRCAHTDVRSANRRSALAKSEGRMPGGRATGGVLSLVTFFAQAKKVTRSPQANGSLALGQVARVSNLRGSKPLSEATRSPAGRVEALFVRV